MQYKKKLQKILDEVAERPLYTTTGVFVVAAVIVFILSYPLFKDDPDSYVKSVMIEAHSMLFDLAIIGILLLWLNNSGEKRVRIRRCIDEIDDIRFWKSPEASYRILANVKRLLRDNVTKIDLNNCYLRNLNLNFANLKGANLNYADLEQSTLIDTNFVYARLNQANFNDTNLNRANMSNSLLSGASMKRTKGIKTNFEKACLIKADFQDAFLIEANFQDCDMSGAEFENANLYMPDFRGVKGLLPEQLSRAKMIVKPKFDTELESEINQHFPEILKNNQSPHNVRRADEGENQLSRSV
ncbi:MAG: pentapeptide repeat-containing protein [Cytophagales bacterium]|nr:MAG: pentapeptide repeat-containing protein [Cytophagales bacterium]